MARIVWKRGNVLISIGIFFGIATALFLIPKYIFCDDQTSVSELQELCRLYSAGELAGDLCQALCTDRSLRFHKCLHVTDGKVVLRMSWNATLSVIMKSEHASWNEFLGFDFQKISAEELHSLSAPALLRDRISNLVGSRFGKYFDISRIKVWNIPGLDDRITRRDATTLWLLLQQDEYLIMSYLNGQTGIPQLYGNCGHYYAMEFLPPGRYLSSGNFLLKAFSPEWQKRADLAVRLMDVVQAFDNDYHEPLHFCDMKGLNFGVGDDGHVKAIDLDMAVFETHLLSQYSQMKCVRDVDCEYFDCSGWCLPAQQKCLPIRINTNIQTLCQKVFIGGIREHAFVGLLDGPPLSVKSELNEALDRCANPPVNQLRKFVTDSCQSAFGWSNQSHSAKRNFSSTNEFKCQEALKNLRILLAEESTRIHKRLKKIL